MEGIRRRFLAQNAYTDDAFSTPEQTYRMIRQMIEAHHGASARLEKGERLEQVLGERR